MTSAPKSSRRVAVFCGSATGSDPAFRAEATALGAAVAKAGIGLVYGGACRGLMGAVADAALAASIFHYGTYTVDDLKEYLDREGIPVRKTKQQ